MSFGPSRRGGLSGFGRWSRHPSDLTVRCWPTAPNIGAATAISDRGLAAFHRPRLEVLAGSGADLLACETIPCVREALVLAQLLEEHPAMTAWISFSCRDGAHDCEGEPISECAAALRDHPQIAAVGVNCSRPEHVHELLCRMRVHTDKPLIAYPNSGEAYDAATKSWSGARVAEAGGSGARLVSGGGASDRRLLPHHAAGYRRAARVARSVVRKMRLALLEERAHALDAIVRLQRHLLGAALGAQLLLQRIIEGRCVQRTNLAEHRARAVREPARHLLRTRDHLGIRHHRIGEAPIEGGLGVNLFRQHQRGQ